MIKKIFILLFVSSIAITAHAQKRNSASRHPNLQYFENDRFHFGFSLGGNTTNFKINYDLTTYDSLVSIQSNGQAGFNIGLISSMRFNTFFTLRFTPTLAFAQRNVEYVFQEGEPVNTKATQTMESTYIQFPLLLKYRSVRNGNFAAYVIGGGNLTYDLSAKPNFNNDVVIKDQLLKTKNINIFAEGGFGVDMFMEYFKFSIELKYGYGLTNIFIQDDSFWAAPITDIRPKMFTISLHFEG